jgi:hypothetical protein
VADLCDHLTEKQLLTAWQCGKLDDNKYKGFFLDGFKLLEQVGKDTKSTAYLVEEVATGRRLAMVVTPPALIPNWDGRIQYEIHELPAG